MHTPSELTTFKGDEVARKFFYFYENVVTNSLPDSERAEKIVACLSRAAFDFYFDLFILDNAPTEEAKEHGLVKKAMLEKFSTQKTESEMMRESLTLRYDGSDIPTFLSRAEKVYNQAEVGENVKFELLRDALKSDQMFFQFLLHRRSKNYEGINKSCLKYTENIKMMGVISPAVSADEKVRQELKRRQDRRAMQASRKPSFDDDETAQASAEAGGTSFLQVWKEGPLRVTVQDGARTCVLRMW